MNIAVIGTGYVGLVTGVAFASLGHRVACVDTDSQKVESLSAGAVPFLEPGLQSAIAGASKAGRIEFTTDLAEAVSNAEVAFITVGTPPNKDGSADIGQVLSVAGQLGDLAQDTCVIVVRSTVPVGTTDAVKARVNARRSTPLAVMSNPEFLREGNALADFMHPSRVVIGVAREHDANVLVNLYRDIVATDRIVITSTRSAEMAKYASNAFLATRISFMNEISDLCAALGSDVEEVRKVMGMDPRIGPAYLSAGLGYGGMCLPKDVRAAAQMAQRAGIAASVLTAVDSVNRRRPKVLVDLMRRHLEGDLRGKRIALWGLAFKPETDDMRFAQSLPLIDLLVSENAEVIAYDPAVEIQARTLIPGKVKFAPDMFAAVERADGLVLVTEWDEFLTPDWERVSALMTTPIVFDGRNVYDAAVLEAAGMILFGMGRGAGTGRAGVRQALPQI